LRGKGREMEKHVTLVAALNIGFGILGVLIACLAFVVIAGAGAISGDPEAIAITSVVATAIAVLFITLSIPEIIGGIGLLKHRNWARILVLIIAVLYLFQIPFGTIIGIYTIWVLLNDETAKLFTQDSG
jgi:hypothetical protein